MNKLFKYSGTGNNGTFSWVMQRISAIVLIFALGYHLIGKLMVKIETEENPAVMNGSNPILMGALWLFITFHAFNGLKMVTDDYVSRKGTRFILYLIYWTLAVIMLLLGRGLISL